MKEENTVLAIIPEGLREKLIKEVEALIEERKIQAEIEETVKNAQSAVATYVEKLSNPDKISAVNLGGKKL